ncbi:annexin-2 receptor-like [Rhynchonycteris naso]
MEQYFGDAVKRVWDYADQAPEPLSPAMRSSEDSGPWPLPLYPALGESSVHRGDDDGRLLSSPCWQLPSIFHHDRGLSSGAWTATEPNPGQSLSGPRPGALTTPEAPAETPEPAEQTTLQHVQMAQTHDDAVDGALDTEISGRAQPEERRPPPRPAAWRRQPLFSGLLRWISGALSSLSCGGLPTSCDLEEPSDGSGGGPSGDVLG